jgi:hypothetical protein
MGGERRSHVPDVTDEASEWSDEDLSDFTAASSRHAERATFQGE